MFEDNDRPLLTAKSFYGIGIGICVIIVLVVGIIYAVNVHWAYIFMVPIGWLFCWLAWILIKLLLSFLCDVKLIRNKLYGLSNTNLIDNISVSAHNNKINEAAIRDELSHLLQLLDEGKISEEEYMQREEELIGKRNSR